jgi:hypothetical protein
MITVRRPDFLLEKMFNQVWGLIQENSPLGMESSENHREEIITGITLLAKMRQGKSFFQL